MKKIAALLLALLMMTACALAEIEWPAAVNNGQHSLQTFVDAANAALTSLGESQIDMMYELYSTFASLGMDGADVPENVEMYFVLSEDGLYSLQLRVTSPERFTKIAAACLYAASPPATSMEQAMQVTGSYAAIASRDVYTSFEEAVEELQGAQPRAYFAYYPDQYSDGRSWLQMTLIFARPGSEGAAFIVPTTPAPEAADNMYEGYFSNDNYTHLEVFPTATPEPDSAAMEP